MVLLPLNLRYSPLQRARSSLPFNGKNHFHKSPDTSFAACASSWGRAPFPTVCHRYPDIQITWCMGMGRPLQGVELGAEEQCNRIHNPDDRMASPWKEWSGHYIYQALSAPRYGQDKQITGCQHLIQSHPIQSNPMQCNAIHSMTSTLPWSYRFFFTIDDLNQFLLHNCRNGTAKSMVN